MKSKVMYAGMVVLVVLLLAGCGGSSSSGTQSLEGSWVVSSMEMDGDEMVSILYEIAEETGDEFDPADLWYYKFTKDGKVVSIFDSSQIVEGTYKLKDNALTLTIDGDVADATMDGDSFTFERELDGRWVKATFKKQ